ncbi:hypothetical protein LUZ60_000836 [Juncus effusus]|nr:hypothetical protein LUZ60_000836 [Juncus effusus]
MERMDSKKMHAVKNISSLPDCLLHHILSFLETKEMVRTSVLSKRWINVWKSVPHIGLDSSDFNDEDHFKCFVNSILHHKCFPNPEQIETFFLKWRTRNDDVISRRTIKTWIHNLVSLKPEAVSIELSKLDKNYSFSDLFTCSTLGVLFLFVFPQLSRVLDPSFCPAIINLPSLKVLHLGLVLLKDEFIKRLVKGCPILEELVLERCFWDVTEKISSNSVKTLTILRPAFFEDTILRISSPSLVNLECEVDLGHIAFDNLKSLEFASVTLQHMKNGYFNEDVKLLGGLSNAKTIKLSGSCVEYMLQKEAAGDLPVFKKLESLDLADCAIFTNLDPLDSFLKRTPNLKKLTLQHISVKRHLMMLTGRPSEIQCCSLKTVEIVCSRRDEEMHELVKSLLMRLKAIQNISITPVDDDDDVINVVDDDDDVIFEVDDD